MRLSILSTKRSRVGASLAAGVAACALFALAMGPALAAPAGADPTPTPTSGPTRAQKVDERLATLYQREQKLLSAQKNRLDKSSDAVGKAQARIDQLNGKGKDTSLLATGLSDFKAAIGVAQGEYNTAKSALDTHAGFDANGSVTDVSQARSTLRTAGDSMRQFHQTVKQALQDLRATAKEYRNANRKTP